MRTGLLIFAGLMAAVMMAAAGDIGTDPTNVYAWGENIGWVNAGPSNNEVLVHFDGTTGWLSGYAWGENVGWISFGAADGGPYANTSSTNWGVNLASDGQLSGYAYGGNVGWVNFGHTNCDAAIHTTNGQFFGHAWCENTGWLTFSGSSPDYGVRTLAFDLQPMGTPNWWLDYHGVLETYDAGDGVVAWQKYVMDTDPNVVGDILRIIAISNVAATTDVKFTPSSTQRYYTLVRSDNLVVGNWSNVTGQVNIAGVGGNQALQDTESVTQMFYRVEVRVTP